MLTHKDKEQNKAFTDKRTSDLARGAKVTNDKLMNDKLMNGELNDDKLNDDKLNDDKVNDDKVNDDRVNDVKAPTEKVKPFFKSVIAVSNHHVFQNQSTFQETAQRSA